MIRRFVAMLDGLGLTDDADPFVRAVRAGARADDVGEAFYAGYQAALSTLVSSEVENRPASLCVTERGGGHPRSILCAIRFDGDHAVLDGEKTFVTGADRAEKLFIVVREPKADEDDHGRPTLRLVRLEIPATGVTLHPLPPTPFAPGISHARIVLEDVRIPAADVLPGDGYLRYVKPFRTVEDIHVVAAVAARVAAFIDRLPGEDERVERILALVLGLGHLAKRPPLDPSTHRALAGTLDLLRVALDGIDTALEKHSDRGAASAMKRDLAILGIAEVVRHARLESARAAFAE